MHHFSGVNHHKAVFFLATVQELKGQKRAKSQSHCNVTGGWWLTRSVRVWQEQLSYPKDWGAKSYHGKGSESNRKRKGKDYSQEVSGLP